MKLLRKWTVGAEIVDEDMSCGDGHSCAVGMVRGLAPLLNSAINIKICGLKMDHLLMYAV